MAIGKNTLKALKDYYNKPFEPLDTKAVLADLEQESDRAVVIIMGSILDDTLRLSIIEKLKLRKSKDLNSAMKQVEKVFGFNGPMGSFSDRVTIAHAFNIIEDETRNQLTIVREMRNACAHSQKPISFETPALFEYCMNLWHADNKPYAEFAGDPEAEVREAFMIETMFLTMALNTGSRSAARRMYELHVAGTPSDDERRLR